MTDVWSSGWDTAVIVAKNHPGSYDINVRGDILEDVPYNGEGSFVEGDVVTIHYHQGDLQKVEIVGGASSVYVGSDTPPLEVPEENEISWAFFGRTMDRRFSNESHDETGLSIVGYDPPVTGPPFPRPGFEVRTPDPSDYPPYDHDDQIRGDYEWASSYIYNGKAYRMRFISGTDWKLQEVEWVPKGKPLNVTREILIEDLGPQLDVTFAVWAVNGTYILIGNMLQKKIAIVQLTSDGFKLVREPAAIAIEDDMTNMSPPRYVYRTLSEFRLYDEDVNNFKAVAYERLGGGYCRVCWVPDGTSHHTGASVRWMSRSTREVIKRVDGYYESVDMVGKGSAVFMVDQYVVIPVRVTRHWKMKERAVFDWTYGIDILTPFDNPTYHGYISCYGCGKGQCNYPYYYDDGGHAHLWTQAVNSVDPTQLWGSVEIKTYQIRFLVYSLSDGSFVEEYIADDLGLGMDRGDSTAYLEGHGNHASGVYAVRSWAGLKPHCKPKGEGGDLFISMVGTYDYYLWDAVSIAKKASGSVRGAPAFSSVKAGWTLEAQVGGLIGGGGDGELSNYNLEPRGDFNSIGGGNMKIPMRYAYAWPLVIGHYEETDPRIEDRFRLYVTHQGKGDEPYLTVGQQYPYGPKLWSHWDLWTVMGDYFRGIFFIKPHIHGSTTNWTISKHLAEFLPVLNAYQISSSGRISRIWRLEGVEYGTVSSDMWGYNLSYVKHPDDTETKIWEVKAHHLFKCRYIKKLSLYKPNLIASNRVIVTRIDIHCGAIAHDSGKDSYSSTTHSTGRFFNYIKAFEVYLCAYDITTGSLVWETRALNNHRIPMKTVILPMYITASGGVLKQMNKQVINFDMDCLFGEYMASDGENLIVSARNSHPIDDINEFADIIGVDDKSDSDPDVSPKSDKVFTLHRDEVEDGSKVRSDWKAVPTPPRGMSCFKVMDGSHVWTVDFSAYPQWEEVDFGNGPERAANWSYWMGQPIIHKGSVYVWMYNRIERYDIRNGRNDSTYLTSLHIDKYPSNDGYKMDVEGYPPLREQIRVVSGVIMYDRLWSDFPYRYIDPLVP